MGVNIVNIPISLFKRKTVVAVLSIVLPLSATAAATNDELEAELEAAGQEREEMGHGGGVHKQGETKHF